MLAGGPGSIHEAQSEPVEWIETQVLGPAVMDRHLAQHARMAANAYQLPWKDSWYELDPTWNTNASFPFGWDSDENGFRDFIFRFRDNVDKRHGTTRFPLPKRINSMTIYCFPAARVDISWVFSTVCEVLPPAALLQH
ncbi:hypothetical protein L210DRAFT_3656274 [Boletus edulis BED1]|uniref:Uncharacterized protein n=1 Tax=Boletus edulis BED1 TaxID=1328754 RepID=A0AAD4BBL8_BOLED|nr:hypothetical protein L210DRAFT_3656274 [Boletus edulis BED1]